MRGVDFNPLSAATVFHLPVRVSSTVKSLFSLSLSLWPFQVQRNSVSIPISGSCHRPVHPQSTHVSNILNHTDVSSLEVVSIIRYLTVARHWLHPLWLCSRITTRRFSFSLFSHVSRESRGNRNSTLFLVPVSPCIFRFNYLHPVGSDMTGGVRIYGRKFKRGELSFVWRRTLNVLGVCMNLTR